MAHVERRGAGRWRARYRGPNGRERSKTFERKADAERFLTEVESSKLRGGFVDPRRASITVEAWADDWLAAQADLTPKTRERYDGMIRRHIRPRWGRVPLASVTHAEVQRWLTGLDLAPASVQKTHGVLSMVLAYAVKDGRLASNPAAGVSLPRVRQAEKRFLTHQQVHELAEACGEEYRLVVLFLAYTGLRWGEMAALRVRRIDFLRRRVPVAESVTPVRGAMTWGETKGHERREVTLPRFLIDDLSRQVAGRSADDLVFTGPRGAVMRSGTFRLSRCPQAQMCARAMAVSNERLPASATRGP